MNPVTVKILIGAACGFTMGATASFFVTNKRAQKKYEELFEEELQSVKDAYARRAKEGPYETPESTLEAVGIIVTTEEETMTVQETSIQEKYADRLGKLNYNRVSVDPEAKEEAEEQVEANTRSIFGGVTYPEGFDADTTEDDERDPNKPYIIRAGEYHDDEGNFEKAGLTWYEGDSTLTDESEIPIKDIEALVGMKNLERFGHLSEDDNIVFVRNERLDRDYEIIRDRREFSEVVYGLGANVLESGPRVGKMRDDD